MRSRYYLKSINTQYQLKQFLLWFGVVVTGLFITIMLFDCVEKLRITMGHVDVHFSLILEMTLLSIPQHLMSLLPFVFFITYLLCLWKLNQSNEILAFRAAGISGAQMGLSTFLSATVMALLLTLFLNPLAAHCNSRYAMLEQRILKKNPQSLAIASTGFWLRETLEDRTVIFHATAFTLSESLFHQVTFYEFNQQESFVKRIDATSALLEQGQWRLKDVRVFDHNQMAPLDTLILTTGLTLEKIKQSAISPSHIPFWHIHDMIASLKKNGMSTLSYELFWQRLWAEIILCGFMAVLAVGFCMNHQRSAARLWLRALVVGFFVHFLTKIIYAYGESDQLSTGLSAWIPVLLTGLMGTSYVLHEEEID